MTNIKSDELSYSIAIIGCGPRGISVLERLAALMSTQNMKHLRHQKALTIHIIDAYEIGAGRIWRKNQPDCLLMNTLANETTMFSGPPDDNDARPGAGPSLAQWWVNVDPNNAEPKGLAPRKVYGEYLNYVFNKTVKALSLVSAVNLVKDSAIDLHRTTDKRWEVVFQKNKAVLADRVVLATGNPLVELDNDNHIFQTFSKQNSAVNYIRGDSAADMNLEPITPQSKVGIIGCGAAFFDVVSLLTEGRGGRFDETPDGQYIYLPSGLEPKIHAGSRGGAPFPARSVNQKAVDYFYTPYLFTKERMLSLRKIRNNGKLDFRKDVLPWLEAEMQLIYTASILRAKCGEEFSKDFIEAAVESISVAKETPTPKLVIASTAEKMKIADIDIIDIKKLAHPFHGAAFNSHNEYLRAVKEWICNDIVDSLLGNIDSPIKAATDVLRDVRPVLQSAVDYGGLTPESHKEDFLGSFVSLCSTLSAGPPIKRLKQLLALMDSGQLTFAGPEARFNISNSDEKFQISSQSIEDSTYLVDTLIDARIPTYNLNKNISPLKNNLLRSGFLTSFKNSLGEVSFDTGGVAVTPPPFHPITKSGPETSLYVIGIPLEHTRWFMQVGIARPGPWGQFTKDADAIARDLVLALPLTDSLRPSGMVYT
jgi:hypothetical protein